MMPGGCDDVEGEVPWEARITGLVISTTADSIRLRTTVQIR